MDLMDFADGDVSGIKSANTKLKITEKSFVGFVDKSWKKKFKRR